VAAGRWGLGQRPVSVLLDGIRVLDLTTVLAGPLASYQLALLGADVVKIEVPGSGDIARQFGARPGASFLALNGGKRSLTLNLKHQRGKQVFERALERADVLLENFRPGVLARLGFPVPKLQELNPRLVYCSLTGFGQTGPLRDRPAYDQIIQGLSGMMSVTGTPETAPLRAGFPVSDALGGLTAGLAVVAGLVHRAETGQGCILDVSMLEASLSALGWHTSDYLTTGQVGPPMGNANGTAAPSGTFQAADGPLNISANTQQQFVTLCRLLDREDLLSDPRFAERAGRLRHRAELDAELAPRLAQRSAAEWEERLCAAGVPAGRVLSVPRALALEQLAHRQFVHDGWLGSPIHVNGQALGPRTPPPELGQHTDELLAELGLEVEEIGRLRSDGVV
jgi:crotonobetainyl-CoA:carnitine CoA-transferase CaiB-like acyl-CoA transferase